MSRVLNKQKLDVEKRGQNASVLGGLGTAAGSIIGALITRGKKAE